MALYSTLRGLAARITPIASRLVVSQRTYHSRTRALYSAVQSQLSYNLAISTSLSSLRHYSSAASRSSIKITTGSDWKLLELLDSIIDSIIDSVKECQENREDIEFPEWFPFQIEDIPGQPSITLSRKYQGENINVKVNMQYDTDEDADRFLIMTLLVSVAKSENYNLLFDCIEYNRRIWIKSLSVKKHDWSQDDYEEPDYGVGKHLEEAFDKYLEVRGVKTSTVYFLKEYMIRKNSREYLNWLQKLKKFA